LRLTFAAAGKKFAASNIGSGLQAASRILKTAKATLVGAADRRRFTPSSSIVLEKAQGRFHEHVF
jgi:hypothetical protein